MTSANDSQTGAAEADFRRIPFAAVAALSLALLLLAGVGEAYQTYTGFIRDKLNAQGEVLQQPLNHFLQAGLSLDQFPGYPTLLNPLLQSDSTIRHIRVLDAVGHTIFATAGESPLEEEPPLPQDLRNAPRHEGFFRHQGLYLIYLPLENKFEEAGYLELGMDRKVVAEAISSRFFRLAGLAVLATLIATGSVAVAARRRQHLFRLIQNAAFTILFLTLSAAVAFTLIEVYSQGIQGKAKALARSLQERLGAPLELGLRLDDLEGIDETLQEYQQLNPDISFIALTRGQSQIMRVGGLSDAQGKSSEAGDFEVTLPLLGDRRQEPSNLSVTVGIPKSVLHDKLWHGVKNFVALFVGVFLLSRLFLNLLMSFQKASSAESRASQGLMRIRVVHTITVFIEGLGISFLPMYLQDVLQQSGQDADSVSTIFLIFFGAYVLSLMPAGRYAERHEPRKLIQAGVALSAVGLLGLPWAEGFFGLSVLRAVGGFGQGMAFIGVQSLILQSSPQGRTVSGASIIVLGYQTGVISGAALGALLVVYTGPGIVFTIGALLGFANLAFNRWALRPADPMLPAPPPGAAFQARGVVDCLKDLDFIKTALLIGLPTKALVTGVIFFGMPLLLDRLGYDRDDIGQILMFYAAGVLISNLWAGAASEGQRSSMVLFWGAVGGGSGLLLMGAAQSPLIPAFVPQPALFIGGMVLLGLAHGLVHGPVLSHIANLSVARRVGRASLASFYRFAERLGTVAGPAMVAWLFAVNEFRAAAMGQIGVVVIAFAVLFMLLRRPAPRQQKEV